MNPIIGILGGMGPRATVAFESILLERFPGNDQAVPTIISLNDGSIPDRSAFLLGQGASPVPRLQRNLTMLEMMGAGVICLPCNTACAAPIFDELITTRTLLHLPTETVGELQRRGDKRVLLLATRGTIAAKTYQTLCADNGITCDVLSVVDQHRTMAVIRAVKRGDMRLARSLASSMRPLTKGYDSVILGCTELPLVAAQLAASPAIDTLAVLADACVRYTKLKGVLQ